jgi:hypothetical protein
LSEGHELIVVVRDVLDVAGHRINHPEEGPDRLNVLVRAALAVVEAAACNSVSRRKAGEPRAVIGTGLRRVVCGVEDLSVDCQLQTVRGQIADPLSMVVLNQTPCAHP